MTKTIELHTDRALIKSNFDGYKLSLESVPVIKNELETRHQPRHLSTTDEQYSFLHAELFSMQNFLVQDPWNRESSYYIGENGASILRSHYNENTGRPSPLQIVYRFSSQMLPSIVGGYNISFRFVSEKYCVLCDGEQHCILFDTGDRYKASEWKQLFRYKITDDELSGFIIKDSRFDMIDGQKVISCILQHVHFDGISHLSHLYWGVLQENSECSDNLWFWNKKDILSGKGSIAYCCFEPKASSVIVSSNKKFKFESNEMKIEKLDEKENTEKTDDSSKSLDKNTFKYSWTQTEDDLMITFQDENNRSREDYKVICTNSKITVKSGQEVLLDDGKLFSKIDADLTIWTMVKNCLEITLTKSEPNNIWPYLIEGGPAQVKCSENGDNKETSVENQPIPNLETPVEDCDLPSNSDEEYFIVRLNINKKDITHQILLGSSPPLFSTYLRPGFPPAIAVRTDVDASIWLQQYNPDKPDEWNLRHEGNLHAMGYVQASKQQKKFMDCAPDLNFSVICESYRHVFIYKANYETASGLRNRSGPQIAVGKQSVITLEETGQVLGMSCGINFITLLTEKFILYLQINNLA